MHTCQGRLLSIKDVKEVWARTILLEGHKRLTSQGAEAPAFSFLLPWLRGLEPVAPPRFPGTAQPLSGAHLPSCQTQETLFQ